METFGYNAVSNNITLKDNPRIECLKHGVKTIDVPWSEKHSHFTLLFERLAIDVLLALSQSNKGKGAIKTKLKMKYIR